LPDISKYPLSVEGNGDINIEIFTSGEKAGDDTDSWLIECAKKFNASGATTSSGKKIGISVRSVSSGLAADYIISGKYLPDLYTPSNSLFGEYAITAGAKMEEYNSRLVGNTAGILVKKGSSYKDAKSILDDVMAGKFNIGYTNPQTSATGLNLLIEILKTYGGKDMFGQDATSAFSKFNNNIPFIAYTTQQMRDSASSGTLDGMVTEYQAYVNDKNLTSIYEFIPFGIRHDNPLYIVNKSGKSEDQLDAIKVINQYLTGDEAQKIAKKDGFNANDDYKSDYTTTGAEVTQSLSVYKSYKDSGKDIIAVFVADCSGSMAGDAINELRESLTNGMQYINDNNYVGLISYSNDVTVELPIAQFDLNQKAYFQGAVNNLQASGGTSSYEAILEAVKMVQDAQKDHPDAKTMIFLLSDGQANGFYSLNDVSHIVSSSEIPVYTIGYTDAADKDELSNLSNINEAASINADSDDIMYKIKSLFNSQL
jgi:Ca-activated chloride channel family protein